MSGRRLRLIIHDGNRVCDDRRVTREFQGRKVMDITKKLYHTQSEHYKELGEEITAIDNIKKDKNSGFQLYIAVMKDNEVIEMGLPCVENKSREKRFLNPANIKIDDMDSMVEHLPEDVELALVWRLDRDMTQDIDITGNSIIKPVNGPESDFSLINKKPSVGCSGGISDGVELVADIMEVSIYCGEEDERIRMSMLMVTPPSVESWGSLEESVSFSQPIVVNHRNKEERDELWTIPEFNVRFLQEEKIRQDETVIPENIPYQQEAAVLEQQETDATPVIEAVFVLPEIPKQDKIKLDKNPIIRLIMNPTERKLWGKLYGFPDEDDKGPPSSIKTLKYYSQKPIPVNPPKPKSLKLVKLPKVEHYPANEHATKVSPQVKPMRIPRSPAITQKTNITVPSKSEKIIPRPLQKKRDIRETGGNLQTKKPEITKKKLLAKKKSGYEKPRNKVHNKSRKRNNHDGLYNLFVRYINLKKPVAVKNRKRKKVNGGNNKIKRKCKARSNVQKLQNRVKQASLSNKGAPKKKQKHHEQDEKRNTRNKIRRRTGNKNSRLPYSVNPF
jgi:hypothetical protein